MPVTAISPTMVTPDIPGLLHVRPAPPIGSDSNPGAARRHTGSSGPVDPGGRGRCRGRTLSWPRGDDPDHSGGAALLPFGPTGQPVAAHAPRPRAVRAPGRGAVTRRRPGVRS